MSTRPAIVDDPLDRRARLSALGVTQAILLRAVASGEAARACCLPTHTAHPGFTVSSRPSAHSRMNFSAKAGPGRTTRTLHRAAARRGGRASPSPAATTAPVTVTQMC